MHIRVAAKLFNRHKKPSDRVIATNNIKMPESLRKQVEKKIMKLRMIAKQ
jgi:hypothetical protein